MAPAAAAIAFSVLLSACGGSPSSTGGDASGPAGSGQEMVSQSGGTVVVDVPEVPDTVNVHTVAGDNPATLWLASQVLPEIYPIAPDLVPSASAADNDEAVLNVEVTSVDPLTVVYTINPKAEWSDGVGITAADFIYAWTSQRGDAKDLDGTLDSVASTIGYRDISSVVGSADGRTVTVIFATPYADWTGLFNDLLPAHLSGSASWNSGFDAGAPTAMVSGGPWEISSWSPGSSIVLVPNPHWWGAHPTLDQIIVKQIGGSPADLTGAVTQAQSGEVQVVSSSALSPSALAEATSSPRLFSHVNIGATALSLVFDTRQAPFDTADARQGLGHMLDRGSLVRDFVRPLAPRVGTLDNMIFVNGQAGYTDDAAGFSQPDLTTGAFQLEAAGLHRDSSGTWSDAAGPVVVRLVWPTDDLWAALVGPPVAAQLVSAGFDVQAAPTSLANLTGAVLANQDFTLAIVPSQTPAYPSEQLLRFSPLGAGGTTPTSDSGSAATGSAATPTTERPTTTVKSTTTTVKSTTTTTKPLSRYGRLGSAVPTTTTTTVPPPNPMLALYANDWSGIHENDIDSLFAAASVQLNGSVALGDYQTVDQQLWADMPEIPLFAEPSLVVVASDLSGVTYDDGAAGALYQSSQWALMGAPEPTPTTVAGSGEPTTSKTTVAVRGTATTRGS